MLEEEYFWLVFSVKYGFTWSKWKKLQVFYSSLSQGYTDNFKLTPNLEIKLVSLAEFSKSKDEMLSILLKNKINWVSFLSPNYPSLFRNLNSPPVILYYKGNLELSENNTNLAVIGSRQISNYSRQVMHKVLPSVLSSGVNLVSGLAFGADAIGHQLSLENLPSKTIAVLGGGLDDISIYPNQHLLLANKIVEQGGLLLSEYFPNKPAMAFQFPQRNRLIVALSKAVWVVQAGTKSGTLLTAKIARDTGKDLLVTPASILEDCYSGNHQILQDGAWPLVNSIELFSCLGIIQKQTPKKDFMEIASQHQLSINQAKIMQIIQNNNVSIDEIMAKLGFSLEVITAEIGMLEILGLVDNLGQNVWTSLS